MLSLIINQGGPAPIWQTYRITENSQKKCSEILWDPTFGGGLCGSL